MADPVLLTPERARQLFMRQHVDGFSGPSMDALWAIANGESIVLPVPPEAREYVAAGGECRVAIMCGECCHKGRACDCCDGWRAVGGGA